MKCLLLAAGKGSRLSKKAEVKPLLPVLGTPLIERVIRQANKAGVDDFYIVTGYKQREVTAFLADLAHKLQLPITTIFNDEWDSAENGVSVLKACSYIYEPFILSMADHIYDSEIIRILIDNPPLSGEIALAVDRNLFNPLVDMDDVTRVLTKGGRIMSIGKGIQDYNGFDTGIFLCTPALFEALEIARNRGKTSLSAGVYSLALQDKAKAVDINGQFWIDVDDPASVLRAEKALSENR